MWGDAVGEVQLAVWRARLEESAGNITHAGKALGLTKSYAMRLTRAHGLNEYAAELRHAATGRERGRPPE